MMASLPETVTLAHQFHLLNDVSSSPTNRPILVIFVNGLMLPQAMWNPTLDFLKSSFSASPPSVPVYAITYDRYGQGESIPKDQPDWKPGPHDMISAARELSTTISELGCKYFPSPRLWPKIILVGHSIGVPLVRLHDQHSHPRVYAHLFLDSNIANTDFVSLFPDPDAENFDASKLPGDATVDDLRKMRDKFRNMFHPSIPNSEGLDRRNLQDLLPEADGPGLKALNGKRPFLTVVGHDPVAFANEGFRLNGTPRGLNERYMQPAWDNYNAGLLKLGDPDRTRGVVIAKGAGHFVQRDNPQCVADGILDLIGKIVQENECGDPGKERKKAWDSGGRFERT